MDQKTLETLASPLGCEVEERGLGHTSRLYWSRWTRRLVTVLVLQGLDAVAPAKGAGRGHLPSARGPSTGLPVGEGGHGASVCPAPL